MACATRSVISASSCTFPSRGHLSIRRLHGARGHSSLFSVCASATSEDADITAEERAREKEVGKVSAEWLAGEKTKVVGTYPPQKRGWTGYVEKDTAGQTNIYSVEPAVYVAESAISSGNAGTSAEGSEKTAAAIAGLALVFVAAASTVLIQVGKNPSQMQITEYSGPPLSYYINKFKPVNIVEAAVPSEPQSSPAVRAEGTPQAPQIDGIPQVQVELKSQLDSQTQDVSSSS